MAKLRVLIVDDSVVIRHILREVISSDPQLEVAGVAANGRIALSLLNQLSPDLVTLDIEMPELDGLQTLRELRQTHPKLPVIMFSTLTERGAEQTLDCLAAGANDYVTKPSNVGSAEVGRSRIREQLIPKIKALCHLPVELPTPPALVAQRLTAGVIPAHHRPRVLRMVAIGCSTGGPNALAEVLPVLPANFPLPVLVVQHMPPVFTSFLAQRLDKVCPLQVREAVAGESLCPGTIWIAPGDFHLRVTGTAADCRLSLDQGPSQNSCRPSVDALFSSVAEVFGGEVLAVVMTGMGQDGLQACKNLKERGARIVVQDEASSVVWGMPGFVARAHLADFVLPVGEIGGQILRTAAAFSPNRRVAS